MQKTPIKLLDAFDADQPLLVQCGCGEDHAAADHPVNGGIDNAFSRSVGVDDVSRNFIEASLVKAIFPHEPTRRAFIRAVGRSTAMAAIASVVPLENLQAMTQDTRTLELKELKVGFIAITCATPLIMADPMGFYKKQGLNVKLNKTPGWAAIRDRVSKKEHDASHFLSPMPLAMSLGLESDAMPIAVATVQNNNGQAITLHLKHKARRDPTLWKGMTFGVPFTFSMHNFLLRYYLAEHGVDPDRDVKIINVPPPEMVAKLREGTIDGFLGPDPFNQRAVHDGVGFIHLLSKEIWDGHPCCAFGASEAFIEKNPNTFAALYRAVINASYIATISADRMEIAKAIAPAAYLNQPLEVVSQVLTGKFPDGLGGMHNVYDRLTFNPLPWPSMAVWMLTQMKRWGYIKGDVNYNQIAEKVFLLSGAKARMAQSGWSPPGGGNRRFRVMGKQFDADKAEAYAKSFAISKIV